MTVRCMLIAAALALLEFPAIAQQGAEDSGQGKDAAQLFAEGQQLYQKGQYAEAIKSFAQADELAPHPSAQFNVARCYENLGQPARALKYYEKALASTQDETTAADIRQRVARLKSFSVKIFVATKPSGATVTVGGEEKARAGTTPLVVLLRPGSHVLLLRKEGYHLAAHRVVVQIGKQQTVEPTLRPLPRPVPCPTARCPKSKPLFDAHNLHLHAGLVGAVGWTLGRPLLAAPGVRAYASYRQMVLGTHVLYFPVGEESIPTIKVGEISYTNAKFRSILVQVEGGWVWPLRRAHLSLTAGLGASIDQVLFSDQQDTEELIREKTAFAWSVGASLESMVNRWLSVGASARFGLIHGDRVAKGNPNDIDPDHHFPFLTFWGTLALHL